MQSSDGSSWSNASGTSTNATYSPPALTATTHYRRYVTGGACGTVSSDIIITVNTQLNGGTVTASQTIVSGQPPTELASATGASGGSGTITYQWEQNTGSWNDISGATSEKYQPGALTAPVQYRRKAINSCGNEYSNTLTIVPVDPLSQKYIACQYASVTIGFSPTTDVSYYWYTDQTGGSPISNGSNFDKITVIKDASSVQTWWVEPRYSGVSLPRYQVDLVLGDCSVTTPENCAATGTIIYKEDFGGNLETDPSVSPNGIPERVLNTYGYRTTMPCCTVNGKYIIAKTSAPFTYYDWYNDIDDHTYPGDPTRGYLIGFDATQDPGQFYQCKIEDLCSGTELYFSYWLTSIIKGTYQHPVNHIILIEDESGNILAQYYTGNIPDNDPNWKQYGFKFTVPNGQNTIVMRIINNGAGSSGNDFVMDDIEIRFCAPPVTLTQPEKTDTAICLGSPFTFAGNYTDNDVFGLNLKYRWEKNTGDINNPGDWHKISITQGDSNNGTVNSIYTITSPVAADAGYYRLAVADAANIDNYNCRAMSDIVHLRIKPLCAFDDHATVTCESDTVEILLNDIISPDCLSTYELSIVSGHGPTHGNARIDEETGTKIIYTYTGVELAVNDSLTYEIKCGADSSVAKVHFTVSHVGSAFVDDLWYFGQNNLAGGRSPGIRFVQDEHGNYVAHDASDESKVNSNENSLVVSSPYCDGQNIFYSSHNQLYNSLHQPMLNGSFMGHSSVADGLAACYMGGNRYLFFSVTNSYEDGQRGLNAYIVDMNADNGRGAIVNMLVVEQPSNHMSESIELIAKNGTANQYWLVYAHCGGTCSSNYSDELRVRPIDVGKTSFTIGGIVGTVEHTASKNSNSQTFTLKTSPQHDQLAITDWFASSVEVFDFKNATGELSNRRTHAGMGDAYGVEFSPDGKQLYVARYDGNAKLYQYEILTASLNEIEEIQYWSHAEYTSKGGGLKLGPDNRIYVMLPHSNDVGVISDPNLKTPLLGGRYNGAGMLLKVTYSGLQFSTGLTRPSLMACNMNNPPETLPDSVRLCVTSDLRTVKVGVLANDSDYEGNTIFVTDAHFLTASDSDLATLAVNATSDSVILTVKPGAEISPVGHVFNIIYDVKDNGAPASQCATGLLKVKASLPPNYPDIRIRICPDAGSVNLSKYIDTVNDVETGSIQWTSLVPGMPVSSPAGIISTSDLKSARVYTFTYALTDLCGSNPPRKVYLEKLEPDRMHPLKDTVVICYKYAEAVQINQLFGIEAKGKLLYSPAITPYVSEPASTSPYGGAVVMNGRAIYESSLPTDSYHGLNNVKTVTFTYKADAASCLHDKEYRVVIVLTEDIIN
jgi:hypothetical protein